MTPSSMSNRRRRRTNRRQAIPADLQLVSSHHSAARGDVLNVPEDFRRRPPNWLLTQTPPRSIRNAITWIEDSYLNGQVSISNSAPTYLNVAFTLSLFSAATNISSYFDQYCFYALALRITTPAVPSGGTDGFGTLVTCFDYDNVNAISYQSLLDYASADESSFIGGKSYERFLKPVVANELYTGSVAGAYGMLRAWVDQASSTIPHYGFRAGWQGNTYASLTYNFHVTAVIGFRNNI